MFVVLFVYVFGGAIVGPGLLVATSSTSCRASSPRPSCSARPTPASASPRTCRRASSTGCVPCRCTPPRSWWGAPCSDLLRNIFTFVIMLVVGLLVGFRLEGGLGTGLLATVLLLAFAYAFSWIQALIGLSVKSVEAANSAGLHLDVPDDVHLLGVRLHRVHAELAAADRRPQPVHDRHERHACALQRQGPGHRPVAVDRCGRSASPSCSRSCRSGSSPRPPGDSRPDLHRRPRRDQSGQRDHVVVGQVRAAVRLRGADRAPVGWSRGWPAPARSSPATSPAFSLPKVSITSE